MTTTSSSSHGRGNDGPEPARPHPRWQDLGVVRITLPAAPAAPSGPPEPAEPDAGPPRPRRVVRGPSPDPDRYAYVAPLVARVCAVPMLAVGGLYTLGSGMATDPCSAHGCQALDQALIMGACLFVAGLVALLTSWALPRHLRTARELTALAAPVLALISLLIYFNLPAAT
ncbi:hypothetical protein SAMN05216223_104325 [Actinacidiphila yanglinensis]|uniref:Uncharacterized protein n=1 Tax=Actinacidiphila yanglinensis TaxID=310779 RepID=A0A1H5Z6K4_9ACTN|nr:hypothetical protein [Actinacidiphila yanglinensis]SEG31660.1 hypothetical protein SAMN05216223_104325 [Actinacidiphila yanglinensis]